MQSPQSSHYSSPSLSALNDELPSFNGNNFSVDDDDEESTSPDALAPSFRASRIISSPKNNHINTSSAGISAKVSSALIQQRDLEMHHVENTLGECTSPVMMIGKRFSNQNSTHVVNVHNSQKFSSKNPNKGSKRYAPLELEDTEHTEDTSRAYQIRMQSSWCCLGIYLILALLCVALIILDIVFPSNDPTAPAQLRPHVMFQIFVEAGMTFLLFVEVLFGWIAVAKCSCGNYFALWSSRLDVFVLTLSIVFYLILYTGLSALWKSFGFADVLILVVRYVIQVLRLVVFIQRSKNSRQLADQTDIDFRQLELTGGPKFDHDSMADVSLGFDEPADDAGGLVALSDEELPHFPIISNDMKLNPRVQHRPTAQK